MSEFRNQFYTKILNIETERNLKLHYLFGKRALVCIKVTLFPISEKVYFEIFSKLEIVQLSIANVPLKGILYIGCFAGRNTVISFVVGLK